MSEGLENEREPWREDLQNIRRGLESQMSPEDYMAALESTGMVAHLGSAPFDGRDRSIWQRQGPVGGFGDPVMNGRIAGRHTATWRGRHAEGRELATGTYIIRLETVSGRDSRKIQLLR